MKIVSTCVLCGLIVFSSCRTEALAAASLEDLRGILKGQMLSIKTAHQKGMNAALDVYGRSLESGLKKLQEAGDLDGVIAARKEQARFAKERTVPAKPPATAHRYVAHLQGIHNRTREGLDRKRDLSSAAIHGKYAAALDRMKKNLVVAGKIDEAVAVDKELKRVGLVLAGLDLATTKPAPAGGTTRPDVRSTASASGPRALPDGLKKGLVLHYDFEGVADRIKDVSGNGHHGSAHGAVFGAKFGRIGAGASFKQRKPGLEHNEFVAMPNAVGKHLDGTGDFTIAYWVKRKSLPISEHRKRQGQVDITFRHGTCITMMVDRESRELRFIATQSRHDKNEVGGKTELGKWEFWTGTFVAGGDMVLYKNGIQKGKTRITIPRILDPGESNRIGWKSWNQTISQYHPDHYIDEVVVFSRSLSAMEVKKLYTALK
jgi:hypothetical protein